MKDHISPELRLTLEKLTSEPGVYLMIDSEETVLYVGKASNLKKRVSSYFNKHAAGAKTRSLVSQIARIKVSVTRSETEALLLESSLIKSLRPKYNVLLRDDKSYPYIQVTQSHPFPRIEMVRLKKKPQKGEFYGPYPSVAAVRQTLGLIQKIFKIRNCSDTYFSARSRPCLQFQIKRCSAPCTQYISSGEYQQSVKDATRFLQGKCQLILEELEERMDKAVVGLEFEEAARVRDQIKSLRLVQEQQGVVQLRGDADVIAIEARPGFACIQCVTVREGEILASQSFFPSVPTIEFESIDNDKNLWQQVFEAFVAYFYIETPERIPALIVTDHNLTDLDTLESTLSDLRGKRCKIQIKPRGGKARWLDFAHNNLEKELTEYVKSEKIVKNRYQNLMQALNFDTAIRRMECFDISHTQGELTVASCVVFDENGPLKSEYRRFNISNITPGDDYAAMEQVLMRRFKHTAVENLPDLVIIDGGKGQLSAAKRVMSSLGLESLRLLGIAKGPTRKAGWEQLILANESDQISLPPDSPALHLLQFIRDEAHRFAVTFHRQKRQKSRLNSTLESIEGVGAKRRHALLKRFGGLRELSKAPIDEIAKVKGISNSLAAKIYQHFRS